MIFFDHNYTKFTNIKYKIKNNFLFIRPVVLSLFIGLLGAIFFDFLSMPLAWLLGPMVANIGASIFRMRVIIPHTVRTSILCVIGVLLGGSFTPDILLRVDDWLFSLMLMFLFIPIITLSAMIYYSRIVGFDLLTSAFSAAPGTLTAMVITGGDSGADERLIALTQGLRIVIVIFLMPWIVSLYLSPVAPPQLLLPNSGDFLWYEALFLSFAVLFGYILAKLIKIPASSMSGAMVASAFLYLGGYVTWRPPEIILWICLWILGSAIGSRFSTVAVNTLFRISFYAVGATFIILAVSFIFAYFASWLTGNPFLSSLLSFTPGGVAEMCLIAIAFNIDPAFVATHHLFRILILVTFSSILGGWVAKSKL